MYPNLTTEQPQQEELARRDIPEQGLLPFAPKRCPTCSRREGKDVFKPATEFYPNKGRADGYSVHCRSCQRQFARRSYHRANPNSMKNLMNLKETLVTAGELHPDTSLKDVLDTKYRSVEPSPSDKGTRQLEADILKGLSALGVPVEPYAPENPQKETRKQHIARLEAEIAWHKAQPDSDLL